VTDKSITRTIETVLSAPDSLGRQYPEKTLETETRNDVTTENQQHEQIITDLQSKNERLTSEVAELTKKLDQAKSSKTQTTTKVPIWTYIVVLLTGSALALLIRRWLKRKFNL
jgi:predicted RNase H-like nuclease (RuvC/YqgF family)